MYPQLFLDGRQVLRSYLGHALKNIFPAVEQFRQRATHYLPGLARKLRAWNDSQHDNVSELIWSRGEAVGKLKRPRDA
jgi:hypothetical protein